MFFGSLSFAQENLKEQKFKNPPSRFCPMPFWHINGVLTEKGITKQMTDAKVKAGFGGVAVLPRTTTRPVFLSEGYFKKYQYILKTAKDLKMNVILYDDINFPSGTANGQLYDKFPGDLRKELNKSEYMRTGPEMCQISVPDGELMASVAINLNTLERINLKPFINEEVLRWNVPDGEWKIMFFLCKTAVTDMEHMTVDYLDTASIRNFIHLTYDKYAKHFGFYFQNTIKQTFYDDVGFWHAERTWTNNFDKKFEEINGFDPDIYYPALWYNIGPETESARVAFYNTRAELLSEGYPMMVSKWTGKYGLKSTGHTPDNYGLQPVAMSGDVFKFYRHSDIPLADYIINYNRGRNGFKLISSTSDLYDRPVTGVEIYGAFNEEKTDSLMLYRALMEIEARGINFVIPHGMWYDTDTIAIPPLISPFNKSLAPALPAFSNFVGRTCYILQGGRKIVDIALLYPIASLEGGYYFDSQYKVSGRWAYPEADYQNISGILTDSIHRDFTFVHPDYLATDKYKIQNNLIHLENHVNFQDYKLIIIPGGKVIQVKALRKIKYFYDNGGKVIATTLLPSKSAEMGHDEEVRNIIYEMFGKEFATKPHIQTNKKGGKALFIQKLTTSTLAEIIDSFLPDRDVTFSENYDLTSKTGHFAFLHKVKKGRDIYFFANSENRPISTEVSLLGKLQLENWDPHSGEVSRIKDFSYFKKNGQIYTHCHLYLKPVKATFLISKKKNKL